MPWKLIMGHSPPKFSPSCRASAYLRPGISSQKDLKRYFFGILPFIFFWILMMRAEDKPEGQWPSSAVYITPYENKNVVGKYISGCYCYCCFRLEFLAPSLEITMSMEITVVGNQSINVKVFVLNVQCFFGVSMLWLCATCQDCVKQNIGILKVAWV